MYQLSDVSDTWTDCRVDNFVNELDIVPRLLGQPLTQRGSLVEILRRLGRLPTQVETFISTAASYRPIGYVHVLSNGALSSSDSSTQTNVLHCSLSTTLEICSKSLSRNPLAAMTYAHGLLSYQNSISRLIQNQLHSDTSNGLKLVSQAGETALQQHLCPACAGTQPCPVAS